MEDTGIKKKIKNLPFFYKKETKMTKDCSWCNEKNCPVTENMVSKTNLFFFSKSRESLIEKVRKRNHECVKVCEKCALDTLNKIGRSGKARGPFGIRNWRKLSESELYGLNQAEHRYSKLAAKSRGEEGKWSDIFEKGVSPEAIELIEEERYRLELRFQELGDLENDPSFGEDPEEMVAVSRERSDIFEKLPMIDAYLSGMNYITYLICYLTAHESRYRIDKNITGQDRINEAVRKGYLEELDDEYVVTQSVIKHLKGGGGKDWDLRWEEAITKFDPSSSADFIGKINPDLCYSW